MCHLTLVTIVTNDFGSTVQITKTSFCFVKFVLYLVKQLFGLGWETIVKCFYCAAGGANLLQFMEYDWNKLKC